MRGYEVCDENPSWVGDTCIAVLQRSNSELEVVYQSCFIRDAGTFHENCILREQPANVYSCLCNTTLCNGINASLIAPSNTMPTSTYKPKGNCVYNRCSFHAYALDKFKQLELFLHLVCVI